MESVFEHGVDPLGRRVYLQSDVGEQSIAKLVRGIYLLGSLETEKPIELFVSSYGGALDESFQLHDVTRTVPSKIYTVALGKCQSAAPLLVAAGHKGNRWASVHCEWMLHNVRVSYEEDTSPTSMVRYAEAAVAAMDRYAQLLGKYTAMSKRHWLKIFRSEHDTFFTSEQAVEWGLVDHIWDEKA